ncbi:MAG: FG-GAP-like repeat-containing protein, partial [bacterium]|nr:FG-GAP-like repeat-containing protein [bacterium]
MADDTPDVTHHVRLLPNGEIPPLSVEPGKHHALVVHVEGQEDPQAMTPEVGGSEGGVSLPKLGEKFSVNPVMGSVTGSIAFPVPPGRTLTPSLGLGYDSNGENGPFGQGWALSVPYFQRATTRPHLPKNGGQSARGVPTYDDAAESDVFVFSDAAELVKVGSGSGPDGYTITRYQPRLESGFSRIERWEKAGISHWRVTSASNVVSLFGVEPASRVADPDDPARVFRWNLCAQLDPLGNTLVYQYVTDTDVEPGRALGCQSVLLRALYANKASAASAFPMASEAEMLALCTSAPEDFLFEVLLDWEAEPGSGELAQDDPSAWLARKDAFSFGRAGFEVRTRRLCRGVRVVHRLGGQKLLVSRTELTYNTDLAAAMLTKVEHVGIGDDCSELRAPAREFIYEAYGMKPTARALPAFEGLDLSKKKTNAEFIDLDGRATAGLLVRHMGQFDYHRRVDAESNAPPQRLAFGASASSSQDAHRQRFFDLDLDGRPALVELGPGGTGQVWERNADDDGWKAGAALPSVPPEADFDEETGFPRVLWGDLDGDGRTDALVVQAQGEAPTVWRFEGPERGWEPVATPPMPGGAGAVLDDPDACVLLVDLSGDGLPDLVHVDHGALTVWPGLGHGLFGEAVSMGFPVASLPTRDGLQGPAVDPRRIRAFDIDGIGGADLLILEDGQARVLVQQDGAFTDIHELFPIPPFEELGLCSLCRIEGRGTGSFVFAKKEASATVTAVDFFPGAQGDIRQYVLGAEVGGIGLQTYFTYRPSTALEPSPEDASPIARLPRCVPVVTEVESYDLVAEVFASSTLDYRHGCWDPLEREFRGFGFVEQADAQELELMRERALVRGGGKVSKRQLFDVEHALPRTFTRSWFHLGIVPPGGTSLSDLYATEYNQAYDPAVVLLPEPGNGDPEVVRALKGSLLRSESYAEVRPEVELGSDEEAKAEADEIAKRPLAISVQGYDVKTVANGDDHRCLLVVAEQSLSYSYERKETPDPRVSHSAVLEVDDHGVPRKSIEVAYPRREAVPEPTLPLGPTGPLGPTDPEAEETGVRVRLVGPMFEEAKSFVLPSALPGLRAAHAVHQGRAGTEVVVVGHTDTEGQTHDNAALSLSRARSMAALLQGDISVWLAEYEGCGVGVWGPVEDAHMAGALGHASFGAFVDATGGDRAALVAAYFEHAGASLPDGVSVRAVGAGEAFLAVPTPDDTPEPANRRVELFFFDTQADPAPSEHLVSDDGVYEAWASGMTRTVSIDVVTGEVDDPSGTTPPDAGPEDPPPADLISSDAPGDDPQRRTEVVRTEVVTVFDVDTPEHYRVGAVAETKSFAVPGQSGDSTAPFSMAALRAMGGGELLSHARTYFMDDDVAGPFGGAASGTPGGIGKTGIVHSSHAAVFSQAQFDAAFGDDALAKARLESSPYVKNAGLYWAPSGTSEHDPDRFFLATRSVDAFGNAASVEYDDDAYFAVAATDALGNTVRSDFDPRTLAATRVVDANGVEANVRFDALGRVTKTWTVGVDGEGTSESEPATRIEYDLDARPVSVTVHARHEHVTLRKHKRLPEPKTSSHEHTTITYYSGSGGVLQTRTKIE